MGVVSRVIDSDGETIITTSRLVQEVFVIPNNNDYIIYVPLKGSALLVNQSFVQKLSEFSKKVDVLKVEDTAFFHQILSMGLIEETSNNKDTVQNNSFSIEDALRPTHIIVFTADYCNLACKYCFASSGNQRTRHLDPKMIKSAIRLIIDNALEKGEHECSIAFHGGGEPTLEFQFIKMCIEYANDYSRQRCNSRVNIVPGIVTNGMITKDQTNWLAKNMNNIQVSFDGLPEIQNDQRPLINGKTTSDHVLSVIQELTSKNVPHIITKSTVTNKYSHRMGDMARFLCENVNIERFHFGPALNFGRTQITGYCEPRAEDFIKGAIEAQRIAEGYGKKVIVSLAQETFPNVRNSFCGLNSPNFGITLDGRVSACFEVISPTDKRAERFYYGQYTAESESFTFDKQKIEEIMASNVRGLSRCKNCYAKWQCAGDCQARWSVSDNGSDEQNNQDFRCLINRALLKHEIIKSLNKSENDLEIKNVSVSAENVCV